MLMYLLYYIFQKASQKSEKPCNLKQKWNAGTERRAACRFPHVRVEVTALAEPDSWKNKVEGVSTQQNKS